MAGILQQLPPMLQQHIQQAEPCTSLVIGPDTASGAASRAAAGPIVRATETVRQSRWGIARLMGMVKRAPRIQPHRNDLNDFTYNGGKTLEWAMRRLQAYNGLDDYASCILFGPSVMEDIDDPAGIPMGAHKIARAAEAFKPNLEQGAPYLEFFKYATMDDYERWEEDVLEAVCTILGNFGDRLRLRVDLYFEAVAANGQAIAGQGHNISEAHNGREIVSMPFRWPIPSRPRVTTPQTYKQQLRDYIDHFIVYTMTVMQFQGSNKVLQNVVGAMVYARPSNSGGPADLGLYGGRVSYKIPPLKKDATVSLLRDRDGLSPVPFYLYNCPGLLKSHIENDSKCLARCLLTAVDFYMDSILDTNLVDLLRGAQIGAQARVDILDRAKPSDNPATLALRLKLKEKAQEELAVLGAQVADAVKMFEASNRHVRPVAVAARNPEHYKLRNRATHVERAMRQAFKGEHPLFDMRESWFQGAVVLDDKLLGRVLGATRKLPNGLPAALVQVWTLTPDQKLGLTFRAQGATLEYLWKGGRIINIYAGENHFSLIKSIDACNHSNPLGKFKARVYCSLCGDARSLSRGQEKLALHEHRVLKCPLTPGMRMQLHNSISNKHWLGQYNLKARNLPGMILSIGGTVKRLESGEFTVSQFTGSRLLCYPSKWTESLVAAENDTLLALLTELVKPRSAVEIKDPWETLPLPPPPESVGICGLCHYPLEKPSAHAVFASVAAADMRAEPLDEDEFRDSDTDSEDMHDPVLPEEERIVITNHVCPFTGHTFKVHADCHEHAGWAFKTQYIEVAGPEVMSGLVDFLFTRTAAETFLMGTDDKGRPEPKIPTLSEHAGVVRRVTFVHKGRSFTLRPRSAFFPEESASTESHPLALEFAAFCTEQRRLFGLWPGYCGTNTSYARLVLFDKAMEVFPLGKAPTSLVDRGLVEMIKSRMIAGGRLIMGEQAVLEPTEDQHMFMVDTTACYPHVLQTHFLPWDEAETKVSFDFTGNLLDASNWLDSLDAVSGDVCYFLEVSGHMRDGSHSRCRGLSPIFGKMRVRGDMLSVFQRTSLNIPLGAQMLETNVGHYFPLENSLMFAVELLAMMRTGSFVLTEIRRVWGCPAAPWGKPFGDALETARRDYELKNEKTKANAVKQVANAVVGSLAVNPQNYPRMVIYPSWTQEGKPTLEEINRKMDDKSEFTLRTAVVGDCVAFECSRSSWRHTGSTLAHYFVNAVARSQLLDFYYGKVKRDFPSAIMGYGATDSMSFILPKVDSRLFIGTCRDSRHILLHAWPGIWDLGNVPPTSTFLTAERCGAECRSILDSLLECNRAKWGCIKEVTGFAGISKMVINGPNRYSYSAVSSETDTPAALQESDVTKGLPKQWQGKYSIDDFSASLEGRPEPKIENPMLVFHPSVDRGDLGLVAEKTRMRTFLSQWRNTAVVVSPEYPYRHYPLGSRQKECLELLSTVSFRTLMASSEKGAVPQPEPDIDDADIEHVELPRVGEKRFRE